MSTQVGAAGQILIEQEIRDRLGVQPGWEVVQILRDGHLEIYFLPPAEPGASAEVLPRADDASSLQDEDRLREAVEAAMEAALRERYAPAEAE